MGKKIGGVFLTIFMCIAILIFINNYEKPEQKEIEIYNNFTEVKKSYSKKLNTDLLFMENIEFDGLNYTIYNNKKKRDEILIVVLEKNESKYEVVEFSNFIELNNLPFKYNINNDTGIVCSLNKNQESSCVLD